MIANRVLPRRPTPTGRAYVLANPGWLWLAFRAAIILVGPLLLYLFYTDASLPLPGQLLAAVVGVDVLRWRLATAVGSLRVLRGR